jgi:hypothetical protein
MEELRLIDESVVILPYDPGALPTRPAPLKGDVIRIEVQGLPPPKTISAVDPQCKPSNAHIIHGTETCCDCRDGRSRLGFRSSRAEYYAVWSVDSGLYMGGVMDTLDSSSGTTFTYLPIVFEDDCQVVQSEVKRQDYPTNKYIIEVTIL